VRIIFGDMSGSARGRSVGECFWDLGDHVDVDGEVAYTEVRERRSSSNHDVNRNLRVETVSDSLEERTHL